LFFIGNWISAIGYSSAIGYRQLDIGYRQVESFGVFRRVSGALNLAVGFNLVFSQKMLIYG
jgi:hypothetical protein